MKKVIGMVHSGDIGMVNLGMSILLSTRRRPQNFLKKTGKNLLFIDIRAIYCNNSHIFVLTRFNTFGIFTRSNLESTIWKVAKKLNIPILDIQYKPTK